MTHANLTGLDVRDNMLYIAGESCEEILSRGDDNPVYVYDRSVLVKNCTTLRAKLDPRISIHYAIKANSNPEVLEAVLPHVQGFDVASALELERALACGCDPAEISMAGPGKSARDLEVSYAAGITINVESERELERICTIVEQDGSGRRARVAFRVNPDFELKNSGMKMTGGPKPFGIDAEALPAILQGFDTSLLEFRGLHIFCGSQNLKPDSIISAQLSSYELATDLLEHAPAKPTMLNLGGGFGVPYFPGEAELDIAPITENLAQLAERAAHAYPEMELIIELGRYLVANAGFYLCRVTDVKMSRGHTFAVTNGGLHHHLAASGNFGQVIRKNYPVLVGNRVTGDPASVSVVGPLCTPLDLLADKMLLPEVREGDVIAVLQSGAYGYSASPHLFLSHPAPLEVVAG